MAPNPFQRFREACDSKPRRLNLEQLTRGQKYPISKLERKLSDFKDKNGQDVFNLLVFIRLNNTTGFIYTGVDFNNPSEAEVVKFNELVMNNEAPSLVYYGFDGKAKAVDILMHNEGGLVNISVYLCILFVCS